MNDPTEQIRRELVAEINSNAGDREVLEATHGRVWDTDQLGQEFEVVGFSAPFVVVHRKTDGQRGSLCFQHHPRFYFDFKEDR